MNRIDKISFLVFFFILLLSTSLLYFKVAPHSDALFFEDLSHDLFVYHGHWRDWRFAPAPAYFPDMLLYFLSFWILPNAMLRIFFVTACQSILLTLLCLWFSRKISPKISYSAQLSIILFSAYASLVAAHSNIWLFFNTTNTHVAALLLGLLILGLAFEWIKNPNRYLVLLLVLFSGIAKASTAIFLINFIIPCIILVIFFLLLNRNQKAWSVLGLLIVSWGVGVLLDSCLTFNHPLSDRLPMTTTLAGHSLTLFLQAFFVVCARDNLLTFILTCTVLATVIFLFYRFVRAFAWENNAISMAFPLKMPLKMNWEWSVCFFVFLFSFFVTLFAMILSGGFSDIYGHRYLAFPLVLALLLTITLLDSQYDLSKKWYRWGLYLFAGALFLSDLYTIKERHTIEAKRYIRKEDQMAQCLIDLEKQGLALQAGFADYWFARGVSQLLPDHNRIEPFFNEATPFFWISTVGPFLRPMNYPAVHYNFALLHNVGSNDQFDFTPLTIGKMLPSPTKIYPCPLANAQVWFYQKDQLDVFVKAEQRKFLIEQKFIH